MRFEVEAARLNATVLESGPNGMNGFAEVVLVERKFKDLDTFLFHHPADKPHL